MTNPQSRPTTARPNRLPMTVAMGTAFNPWVLGIVGGVGSALGELSGYIAGMTGRSLIAEHQRPQYERIEDLTQRYGSPLLFVLAMIPFPLFDVAGIVAGAMRMRVSSFLVAVMLGKVIKFISSILLGAGVLNWLYQLF